MKHDLNIIFKMKPFQLLLKFGVIRIVDRILQPNKSSVWFSKLEKNSPSRIIDLSSLGVVPLKKNEMFNANIGDGEAIFFT